MHSSEMPEDTDEHDDTSPVINKRRVRVSCNEVPPTVAIAQAIAVIEDAPPDEISVTIHDYFDTEALDSLVDEQRFHNSESLGPIEIRLGIGDYDAVVQPQSDQILVEADV